MVTNKYIFIVSCLFLFSCKENQPNPYKEAYGKIQCRCEENFAPVCNSDSTGLVENFFSGQINGKNLCFSDGVDGYEMYGSTGVSATLPVGQPFDPSLATGLFFSTYIIPPTDDETLLSIKPSLLISTPGVEDVSMSANQLLDSFLKTGLNLPLQSLNYQPKIEWRIQFWFDCQFTEQEQKQINALSQSPSGQNPQGANVVLSAISQKKDDYTFRITELTKETTNDTYIYNVTFSIDCDLLGPCGQGAYFGRVTDGVYKTRFEAPRHQ